MTERAELMPLLNRQQSQLDSIEKQLERVTDVLTRIALLEERRTQDRQTVERLEAKMRTMEQECKNEDKIQDTRFDAFKETQQVKNAQYDEMLESYKTFKRYVIGVICAGLLGAVLLVNAGASLKFPHA